MPAYPDIADFMAYCAERGIALPSGDLEPALLVASEVLDFKFGAQFSGIKTGGRDQEREWPRIGATDIDGHEFTFDEIPREVRFATYELAAVEANSSGAIIVNWTPNKYKRASVDGAVTAEWNAAIQSAWDAQPQFYKVDRIISPLLTAQGTGFSLISGKLVRA